MALPAWQPAAQVSPRTDASGDVATHSMPPPRLGALWLWLLLITASLAARRVAVETLHRLRGPPSNTSPFARPDLLLAARHGRRVIVHHLPGAAPPLDGGLCQLAMRNGERLPRDPVSGDAAPCSLPGASGVEHALSSGTVSEQCVALRGQEAYSFLELDAGLSNTPLFDPRALYVLVMRAPKERYLAEIDSLTEKQLRRLLGNASSGHPSRLDVLKALSVAPHGITPRQLRDNAMVRHLAGVTARRMPRRSISQNHLAGAVARLAHFDALLLMNATQRNVAQLAQVLGWRFWDVTRGDRRREAGTDPYSEHVATLSREESMYLDSAVVYDDMLYEVATAMADEARKRRGRPMERPAGASCELPSV